MGQKRKYTLKERFDAGIEALSGAERSRQQRMKDVGSDVTRAVGDRSSNNDPDYMLRKARYDLERNQVDSRRSRPAFEDELRRVKRVGRRSSRR